MTGSAAGTPAAGGAAQRGSAPCVRATGEALPFTDSVFGAAMSVLSLHHWTDKPAGLAELRRVSRGPVTLIPVPVPADCTDGFEAAYWRRGAVPRSARPRARRPAGRHVAPRVTGFPGQVDRAL